MLNINTIFCVLMIVLASILSACANGSDDAADAKVVKFSIRPGTIRIKQNFTITLPETHPLNMAIQTPMGEWYTIQDASQNILFMPAAEFNVTTKITISPSHLIGATWRDGKRVDGLVFQSAGEYLIYFANNLETEPENTFFLMGTVTVER